MYVLIIKHHPFKEYWQSIFSNLIKRDDLTNYCCNLPCNLEKRKYKQVGIKNPIYPTQQAYVAEI